MHDLHKNQNRLRQRPGSELVRTGSGSERVLEQGTTILYLRSEI